MSSKNFHLRLLLGALSLTLIASVYIHLDTGKAQMAERSDDASVNAAPASFVDPNIDGPVYEVAVQPDGRILIGGDFVNVGGQLHTKVARLNADGSLDPTFIDPDVRPVSGGTVDT